MLSVVIVSYNTKVQTLACLDSLGPALEDIESEIVVIDNASADGSADTIIDFFPEIALIRGTENIGFGRGCNTAAACALGDYLLFLNPDAKVFPNSIANLLALAKKRPEAGIWGGQWIDESGRPDLESYRRFPNLWDMFCVASGLAHMFPDSALFDREVYGGCDRTKPIQVDVVSGAMLLITRELWDRLSGFDPIYFLYSEEVDLCYRAAKLGARPMVTPAAQLYHERGAASPNPGQRLIFMLQGKVTFLNKHWGPVKRPIGKFLLLSWALSRSCAAIADRSSGASRLPQSKIWRTVWRSRRHWIDGYS